MTTPGEKDEHDGRTPHVAKPAKAAPASRPPPKSIGRYTVEHLLGQGGMGRVWLARDTVLGRKVAIKVLRDDLALPPSVKEELIVRMGHEARAAAAVSHPNIVTLYDMGEDAGVGLFLVFEYVTTSNEDEIGQGETVVTLRDRLKLGPLPFPEVAKLARELGSALTFAHAAGVIHRDVKPENILYARTGCKIADFGIARVPDSTITHANMVLGTPAYTAPEALSLGEFGPASDQFSLAATLYESVTGGRAFPAEDAIATAGKVSSEPPPPLHESLAAEPVVRSLEAALHRGLAKTPEARFASCAELGQAVARAIENATLRRTPSTSSRSVLPTPLPALIEVERSPLSSRVAIVERAMSEHASLIPGDAPSPSIYLRRQTHRFQNIATALALLVIVSLALLGRRAPRQASAVTSASAETVPTATPKLHPAKPRPPAPHPAPAPPVPQAQPEITSDHDE